MFFAQASINVPFQASFAKGRSVSALVAGASAARQDTIEEELEAPRPATAPPPAPLPAPPPAPAPSSHDAALAELRRDVRNEVQRLQHKVRPDTVEEELKTR